MKKFMTAVAMSAMIGMGGAAMADESPKTESASYEDIRDIIWGKELSIYEGRGNGDLSAYLANTAENYAAWPPYSATPNDRSALEAGAKNMEGRDQEELAMEFVDLIVNGSTAIIYYQTHMTRAGDGTPVDYRYEVTHTWVLEDGEWMVFGGMARELPER